MQRKITLIYLGRLGAGPVYSLQMTEALSKYCRLQIILSSYVSNKLEWIACFKDIPGVELHFFNTYQSSLGFFLSLFRISGFMRLRQIVSIFSPDVIYAPFEILWGAIIFRILCNIPLVYTVHDVIPHTGTPLIEKMIRKNTMRLAQKIIILNRKDLSLMSNISGLPKEKIKVIPHASFSCYQRSFDKSKLNRIYHTILFVGRIDKYKGLNLLLDAFEEVVKHKEIHLIIAGKGDLSMCEFQLQRLKPYITVINRWIDDSEFEDLFKRIDFVVLPYLEATQSGVIAMSFGFGKSVIATKVGALEEQVAEGTGVLVEVSSQALSKAILDMYTTHSYLQMGENALEYARKKMTWENSASMLIDFIYNT